MTNYHAIGTVTTLLTDLLRDGLNTLFGGAISITSKPLDLIEKDSAQLGLNLFLYHITPNPGFNTLNAPTRNSKGEFLNRPALALNLYYLLTAYAPKDGDMQEVTSQQILAKAMTLLNEKTIFDRKQILSVRMSHSNLSDASSEDYLEDQLEQVKVMLYPISRDELTKLWSSFFQSHYRLSVAYMVTVIILDSKEQIKPALKVQQRKFYVLPFSRPVIYRVEPQIVEWSPDAELSIIGKDLYSEKLIVRFGKISVTLERGAASADRITMKLPPGLTAGIKQVQVAHPLMVGDPPTEHFDWSVSNVVSFVLAPKIISPSSKITSARGTSLAIKISPGVLPDQKVSIFLGHNEFEIKLPTGTPPGTLVSELPRVQIPMDIPVTNPPLVEPYVIRVRVDGSDSFVHYDSEEGSLTYKEYLPSLVVT